MVTILCIHLCSSFEYTAGLGCREEGGIGGRGERGAQGGICLPFYPLAPLKFSELLGFTCTKYFLHSYPTPNHFLNTILECVYALCTCITVVLLSWRGTSLRGRVEPSSRGVEGGLCSDTTNFATNHRARLRSV